MAKAFEIDVHQLRSAACSESGRDPKLVKRSFQELRRAPSLRGLGKTSIISFCMRFTGSNLRFRTCQAACVHGRLGLSKVCVGLVCSVTSFTFILSPKRRQVRVGNSGPVQRILIIDTVQVMTWIVHANWELHTLDL